MRVGEVSAGLGEAAIPIHHVNEDIGIDIDAAHSTHPTHVGREGWSAPAAEYV
jgi:hypothetical protein